MPLRLRTGRHRSGLLASYVREITKPEELPEVITLAEGQTLYKFGMDGCTQHVNGKTFGALQWFKHLVCNCTSTNMMDRKRLVSAQKATQTDVSN